MPDCHRLRRTTGDYALPLAPSLALGLLVASLAWAQQGKTELRIGTSGAIAEEKPGETKGAIETLRDFIKDETSFKNEIIRQKDWRELADKMVKKELNIGVFQGFEFAWAQEKYPALKPLAIAANMRPYRTDYLIVHANGGINNFANLAGKTLSLPKTNQREPQLFIAKLCRDQGKGLNQFFAKIVSPPNAEEALDDVVDKVVQATVVERVAGDAYKRRKPGRFAQLKMLAESRQFPSTVIAYVDKALDPATLERFRDGLLGASKKDRGKELLTMFKLTGFDPVPAEFDQVLAQTRKEYPATNGAK